MASALGRLARLSALKNARASPLTRVSGSGRTVTPSRTAVCTSSGAILPKPKKVSGAFRALCQCVYSRAETKRHTEARWRYPPGCRCAENRLNSCTAVFVSVQMHQPQAA